MLCSLLHFNAAGDMRWYLYDMANVVQLIAVAIIALLYAGHKTQMFAGLVMVSAVIQAVVIQFTLSQDYDVINASTMMVLSTAMLYSTKPSDVIAKAVSFFWFLDSAKEVYDLVSSGNSNDEAGLYIQHGIFCALSLVVWYRYHVAEILRIINDKFYGDGVYLVVGKPRTNRGFWYFISGCSSGSIRYAVVDGISADLFYFQSKWTTKRVNINAINNAAIIKLNTDSVAFREVATDQIGRKWTPKVNCATIMRPVLRNSGYRFNLLSLLPSFMVKQITKQNDRYTRSSFSKPEK